MAPLKYSLVGLVIQWASLARVVAGLDRGGRAVKGLRRHEFAGARLNDADWLLVLIGVRRRHAELRGPSLRLLALELDAREKAGEMVIIVLSVFFERMIVALGAADADTEKRLGGGGDNRRAMRLAVFTDR